MDSSTQLPQVTSGNGLSENIWYRGTSLIRKRAPSQDFLRAPGIGLLKGPRRGRFFMSEVPLYTSCLFLGDLTGIFSENSGNKGTGVTSSDRVS